jgi:hypothetical protein
MLSEGKNLPAISHGVNVRIIARFRDAETVSSWAVPRIIMTKIIARASYSRGNDTTSVRPLLLIDDVSSLIACLLFRRKIGRRGPWSFDIINPCHEIFP